MPLNSSCRFRFLRERDRAANQACFPSLFYPEMYLLEGGYKKFYANHSELCEPCGYQPMQDERYMEDLRHFRLKSKSWAGERQKNGNWRMYRN